MYPAHFFGLFPAFPRDPTVFVAMSFRPEFDQRWHEVIVPAVNDVEFDGIRLTPNRVDTRVVGDSILTEILEGISRCQVFFADVTTIGRLGDLPIRNGNVFYEVGLAQAVRLPEEVLLFRSDSDELLFDVSNVRVNSYDPAGDPANARARLTTAIRSALEERELTKHLTVRRLAESMDANDVEVLLTVAMKPGSHAPPGSTMRQIFGNFGRRSAISRLLALGLLSTEYNGPSVEMNPDEPGAFTQMVRYRTTALGVEVAKAVGLAMLPAPEVLDELRAKWGI